MDTSPHILWIVIFQFVILLGTMSGLQYFICRRYQRLGFIIPCVCLVLSVVIMIMMHHTALPLEMDEKVISYGLGIVFSLPFVIVTSWEYYHCVYKKKNKV